MLIAKLADNASKKTGNAVIMTSHIKHGKDLFVEIMKLRAPDTIIENKNIIGKKSFEFQDYHGVYFISGETDAKTRKNIKAALDSDDKIKITLENDEQIIFNENTSVLLADGRKILAKELQQIDEIDDNFINNFIKELKEFK
jgi:hypothetical protein